MANSDTITNFKTDAGIADNLVNGSASTYPTRYGGDRDSFAGMNANANAQLNKNQATFDAQLNSLTNSFGWRVVGDFTTGFTYTMPNDIGIDASGDYWRYTGALPFVVTAGTVPSAPNYSQVGLQPVATAQFGSLAILKTANVTVGQIVETGGYYVVNDGGAAKYEIVAGGSGVDDGGSYIDLNNGAQAKLIVENNAVDIRQFGASESSGDIADVITAIDAFAYEGLKVIGGGDYASSNAPILLRTSRVNWDLDITVDFATSGFSTDGFDLNNVTGVYLRVEKILNARRYGVNHREITQECYTHYTTVESCEFTAFFNSGVDNTFYKCISGDTGWDLASNFQSKRAKWVECVSYRAKRHGFSTDSNTEDCHFIECTAIDNGGFLNEGSDAYHFEDSTLYTNRQTGYMSGCVAKYTDSHVLLSDPTYINLCRAFRSENCYKIVVDGLDVSAEPLIQTALENTGLVYFGDSRADQNTISPQTVINGLILNFGKVIVGTQSAVLNNPKGGFVVEKLGYGGQLTMNEPDLNASANDENFGKTLITTSGDFQNRKVFINGGTIAQYGSIFDRVCRDVICTAYIESVANPFNISSPDISNSAIENERVVIGGSCSGVSGVFLSEHNNDPIDSVLVENVKFFGTINQLRSANFSLSKWIGCDSSKATIATIETGPTLIGLNAKARSYFDAITLSIDSSDPVTLGVEPESKGSMIYRTSDGAHWVANGITSADWLLLS